MKSNLSNLIILALAMTIIILISIGSFYKEALKERIYNDALVVNQLGKIRGDIQRYAKLKIANKEYTKTAKEIDLLFKDVTDNFIEKKIIPSNKKLSFCSKINALKELWNQIKDSKKEELIKLSEKAWEKSNEIVNEFENIHKQKFNTLLRNIDLFVYLSIVFLSIIAFIVYFKIKKGLEIDVVTDKLTGLYNRLYFNEMYNHLINRFQRNKIPFSLIILDIDNFKKINDTYGHEKGDTILKEVANKIKDSIRRSDLAFRYGGEELVVLLPDTSIKEAKEIAERIRKNVQNIKIDNKSVTISGGVGEYRGEDSIEFFKKVDSALYEAKNSGKNKIVSI